MYDVVIALHNMKINIFIFDYHFTAACTIQEDIVKCKASIQMSGKCLYKSKQGSKCNYSVELMRSEATVKIGTTEITLTNGGTLSECAEFTYDQGTLLIEEDVCKCKEGILYLTRVDIL